MGEQDNGRGPSKKYADAVAKSRGEATSAELVKQSEAQAPALVIVGDTSGMLVDTNAHRDQLTADIASGKWEAAPQIMSLRGPRIEKDASGREQMVAGDTIKALLEGNGPDAEFVDEKTGVVSYVKTWIFGKGGLRVSILSSAQLDRKLPPFVGSIVSVTRGAETRKGDRVHTEYLVAGETRSDGRPRDWATKAERPMLVAPAATDAATNAEDLT